MTAVERVRLRAILQAHPLLTLHGFGEYEDPCRASPGGRRALLAAIAEIDTARAWLSGQQRIENLNLKQTSYGLKHMAERAMNRYIPNGAFIAAAMLDGWKVRRLPDSNPNAWLNISQKGLRPLNG